MLRVGQIGLGAWGIRVLPHLAHVADLGAVVTSSPTKLPEHLRPTLQVYRTPEELFADPTIEAVVVTTPVATHEELTLRALDAGKHVFVEKPLGLSEEAALRCAERAAGLDRRLAVGYIYLHSPCFDYIERLTGTIDAVATTWTKTGSFSDSIVDSLACHEVATLCKLLGEPESVETRGLGFLTAQDHLTGDFRFAGAAASLMVSRVAQARRKTVSVRRDGICYEWDNQEVHRLDGPSGRWEKVFAHGEDLIRTELQDFVDACQLGRAPRIDGTFAAMVHRTLRKVTRA